MPSTSCLVKTVHASLRLPRKVQDAAFYALRAIFHLYPDPRLMQPCDEQPIQKGVSIQEG